MRHAIVTGDWTGIRNPIDLFNFVGSDHIPVSAIHPVLGIIVTFNVLKRYGNFHINNLTGQGLRQLSQIGDDERIKANISILKHMIAGHQNYVICLQEFDDKHIGVLQGSFQGVNIIFSKSKEQVIITNQRITNRTEIHLGGTKYMLRCTINGVNIASVHLPSQPNNGTIGAFLQTPAGSVIYNTILAGDFNAADISPLRKRDMVAAPSSHYNNRPILYDHIAYYNNKQVIIWAV
jgi:hypothetical protein